MIKNTYQQWCYDTAIVMIAFSEGKEISFQSRTGEWYKKDAEGFHPSIKYRVEEAGNIDQS